jgi:hypothetical protein
VKNTGPPRPIAASTLGQTFPCLSLKFPSRLVLLAAKPSHDISRKSIINSLTNSMNKLLLLYNSRTAWTLLLILLLAVIPQAKELIPAPWFDMLMTALTVLAAYFHITPSQNYGTPTTSGNPTSTTES